MLPSSVLTSRNLSGLGGVKWSQEEGSACSPSRDLPLPGRSCVQWKICRRGGLSPAAFRWDPPEAFCHLGREEQRQSTSPRPYTVRSRFKAQGLACVVRPGRSPLLWASRVAENPVDWSHGAPHGPQAVHCRPASQEVEGSGPRGPIC